MSTVADRQPEVVEIDARIAKALERERIIADKAAKVGAKYRSEYAKWEADAVAAELAGKDPTPAPLPPDERTRHLAMASLRAEIERDIRERRRAIVRAADSIRSEVNSEVREILKDAAAPLDDLRRLTARLKTVIAALDDIADARQSLDPSQRTPHRRPPAVTLVALVAAVDHGPDTLLGGRETPKPRTLGVQPGSTLGVPVVKPLEPSPPPAEPTTGMRQVRTSEGAEP